MGQRGLDASLALSVFIQKARFRLFLSTLASKWNLLECLLLGKKSDVSWYKRHPVRQVNPKDDGQPDWARGIPYDPAGHLFTAVEFRFKKTYFYGQVPRL